ncbi:MAG: UDP-N-acetylmuramoyl-L-alanyl-D-glutamate--2,6-diaminopimelate ligase [Polyangiaceae bacterium]|nr:UDP-N-acetylmuramoyl-L-alanyl-D-glutamate--2,6-diaminopimelate ligase [Polyangiaceae bacterium]
MTDKAKEATPVGTIGARLGDLVHEVPGAVLVSGSPDTFVSGAHQDSRRVQAGDLFIARAGEKADGERFIADAISRGAVAVLVKRGSQALFSGAARIEADNVPRAIAFASAAVYGHPTFSVEAVGITGTNGKTTTSYLTAAAIRGAGARPGVVGTLGCKFEELDLPSTHTSPEADELARIAAQMRERGATHLVMEVSSIALAAARADAVRFRIAAFTNLTQDHLDYHGTMEAYAAAKARLFFDLSPGASAINVDDAFGATLAERVAHQKFPHSSILARYSAKLDAPTSVEIAPESLTLDVSGIGMRVRTPKGRVHIKSPLIGAHNASNLLCALSCVFLLDLDLEAAAHALSERVAVPGRLERCDDPAVDDVVVLVDYAHTPDALERVLHSVRAFARRADGSPTRVVCLFGCGGDRDPKKRPIMGETVGRLANVAIVTNDNPRSEDPQDIINAILPGVEQANATAEVIADRRAAIEHAVLQARPGDVILLAGKGHEPYQILRDKTIAFDDRDEARRALAMRRGEKGEA